MLRERKIESFKVALQQGEEFIIETKDPLLSVFFLKVNKISATIYANDLFYQNITNLTEIAGIDFGASIGKVVFHAKSKTKLIFNAMVYPRECINHRYTSSFPDAKIIFSRDSQDPDYKITSNQVFCYWPTQPFEHIIEVNTDTEKDFDRLILVSLPGVIKEFSGIGSSHFFSHDGLEYFMWQADATGVSHNFSIIINNLSKPFGPSFQKMMRGDEAHELTILFTSKSGEAPPEESEDGTNEEQIRLFNILIPVLITFTILLILFAFFSITWAIKVYKETFSLNVSDKEDNDSKEYIGANGDNCPLPYFHPEV